MLALLICYPSKHLPGMTTSDSMPESMKSEAVIHQRLRHESIVSMIGVVFDLDNQGFVLEYVKYGSLANFLKRVTDENGLWQYTG